MRRFLLFAAVIVICISSFFFYQYHVQQKAANTEQMFEVVMAEKMRELYDQAQDWSKPVQMNVHDDRLSGDYKLMSEFLLNYWMQNVEARNHYLRQLIKTLNKCFARFGKYRLNMNENGNKYRRIHLSRQKVWLFIMK